MTTASPSLDQWVLITGASRGIGEVFAKRLARDRWNVILVARAEDKLKALAKRLESEYEVKTETIAIDLRDRNSPKAIYGEVKQRGIVLDGLINNAGFGFGGRFWEVPREEYLAMIQVMVSALVELTHLFLPDMIRRNLGFIINVSSTACFQPLPYSSIYAASKSFVAFFTEALWLETKDTGVRVLNLCPGVTKTDFGIRAGLRDFHKEPFAQTPEAVVETAMKALRRNRPTAISGLRNRLLVFLERLVPHWFLLWGVLLFQNTRRKGLIGDRPQSR